MALGAGEQHEACNVYSTTRNTNHLLFLQRSRTENREKKLGTLQAQKKNLFVDCFMLMEMQIPSLEFGAMNEFQRNLCVT